MTFQILILSLPTRNATDRQRIWRALKACGAAALRDGVYLLPERSDSRGVLEALAAEVRESGGTAHVLQAEAPEGTDLTGLFDRSAECAALLAEVGKVRAGLSAETLQDTLKQARRLRKAFANLAAIDFFPGKSQHRLDAALGELELACARVLSPDEPHAVTGAIEPRHPSEYRGRLWATRRRPWVDRLASAWLIRRFIDPEARILWLGRPQDCPGDALGFDFDGATFSHVGNRVTFEVLAASFGLEQPAITRIGLLVHYLDVGGVQPPEATGIETVLAGLREVVTDDDRLLAAASIVFDGLVARFEAEA